jgi:hypothetical protein
LREAAAIAQVDEDTAAVIPARGHPSKQDDRSARVTGAKTTAVMSAFQLGKKLWHAREVNTNAPAVMAAIAVFGGSVLLDSGDRACSCGRLPLT